MKKTFRKYEVMSRPVDRDGWWIEKWCDTLAEAEKFEDELMKTGEVIMTRIVKTRA